MHVQNEGFIQVYQDVIQVSQQKGKISLVEFTQEDHLIFAFVHDNHLITINRLMVLECYSIKSILQPHNPTED
jgi:hypothetical protein